MIRLNKSDLTEIWNALHSKASSPTCDGDTKWIAQLKSIMRKLGDDGSRALEMGISVDNEWWSIVLLIPKNEGDCDVHQDTWLDTVEAKSMSIAVDIARTKCRRMIGDPGLLHDDLKVVSIIKGKHVDRVMAWRKLQEGK